MSISADEIRAGRERAQMTQQELADELGVSLRTVGSWERGESIPRNRLAAIADVLKLGDGPEFGTAALLSRVGYLAKQRREEVGLSRIQFAKEVGLGSDRTLKQFEFGRVLPSGTSLRKIEKGLGWKLGVVDDMMRMTDRKASTIEMEMLDAEDSLHLASQGGGLGLALVSDDDLLAEVKRRLAKAPASFKNQDPQNLYGLAASTNREHLEDEDSNG